MQNTEYLKQFIKFFENIFFVVRLAWRETKLYVIGLGILRVLGAVIPALQIYIGKLIIDQLVAVIKSGDQSGIYALFFYVGLEVGLKLCSIAIGSVASILSSAADQIFQFSITKKVLEHISKLDISYIESPQFHDKIEQVNRDVTWRIVRMMGLIYSLCGEIISLVALGAVFAKLGSVFIAILLTAMAPVLVIEFREAIKNYTWQTGWARSRRQALYFQTILAAYEFAQEIRLFRLSGRFIGYFLDYSKKYMIGYHAFTLKREKSEITKNLVPDIGYYIGLVIMFLRAAAKQFTLGDVTMYISGYRSAQGSLSGLVRSIGSLYEDHLFINNLTEFLAYKPHIKIADDAKIIHTDEPLNIQFENVSFKYADTEKLVLSNISLSLKKGERIALVGENGAGKTTLIKLLLRFYDPTSGRILVNGTDLREIDLESYYAKIGGIFQEFVRYEGRVREQIGYGNLECADDLEQVKRASQIGKAESFVLKLPNTYETPLGEWEFEDNVQKLSGGQWQRLALSRACMNENTSVMILDEPSASLDPEAEEKFFEEFLSETKGKSIVFISHRFSTVRKANTIYLLEEGSVKESGSHDELIDKAGQYANLFNMQAKWYK